MTKRVMVKNVIEQAKSRSILDVAEALGMELLQQGKYYKWKVHDSLVINPQKNTFNWYSQETYGDPINLVEQVRGLSAKEAIQFINGSGAETVHFIPEKREAFKYKVHEHRNLALSEKFLRETRGLSEGTIAFFKSQGVLAQTTYRNYQSDGNLGKTEPVLVFKYRDSQGEVIGGAVQGIWENKTLHPGRGRIKQILKNSDGLSGLNVSLGDPRTLIAFEAPIDLMSYYEIHRNQLNDVCLVSMDGLKKGTVSRYFSEMMGNNVEPTKAAHVLDAIENTTQGITNLNIVLAVDHDEAGKKFVENFGVTKVPVSVDFPPKGKDWNEALQLSKGINPKAKSRRPAYRDKIAQQSISKKQGLPAFSHSIRTEPLTKRI